MVMFGFEVFRDDLFGFLTADGSGIRGSWGTGRLAGTGG